jgi:methyl-accepting chemotaxis protein
LHRYIYCPINPLGKDAMPINKYKISTILAFFGLGVFALVLIAFTVLVYIKTGAIVKQLGTGEITTESSMVKDQLVTMNTTLKDSAERLSQIFEAMFPQGLTVDEAHTVNVSSHNVPAVKSGDKVLNLDFAAVDQIRNLSSGVATLFVRSGDDFLRVTTSLKKQDGSRALGTFLDKESPAYKSIMAGDTYFGKAQLFGSEYMTKYTPIKNKDGKVLGISFVGADYTEVLKRFKEQIKFTKIGSKGYFYIIDNKDGKTRGNLIIHPSDTDKNVYTDNLGEHYKLMSEQKEGVMEYASPNGRKIAAFVTMKEWDWIVVAAADMDEFKQGAVSLRNILLVVGPLALLLAGVLLYVVVSRKLQPLSLMVENVAKVGEGDLTVRCNYTGQDEIGMLGSSFNLMASQIGQLISEVSKSVKEVNEASSRLLVNARNVEEGSHQQSEAASATAAAVEELSVSINQVTESARDTERLSTRASDNSKEGEKVVNTASSEMRKIAEVVIKSSESITALGQKSNEISSIVNVIKDIAEQTNLLALNAAIEAARAGEQGRGFAVVADEVRKLAERTSKATTEISSMIASIQNDIGTAVTNMKTGSEQVGQGVMFANQAATALSSINEAAKETMNNISDIVSAMQEQSVASNEIAQNIEKIAGMADENNIAVQDTTAAANQLATLASSLKTSLSRFIV